MTKASLAFLLAQLGSHAAARFADRLSPLDLMPAHAGTLRLIDSSEGISQQALGAVLGVAPSRLVVLIDELQQRRLVDRRDHPHDRRSYALYLTEKGRDVLKVIGRAARDHEESLCAALSAQERADLASLLERIARQQGLKPGVHPGFSRMRP